MSQRVKNILKISEEMFGSVMSCDLPLLHQTTKQLQNDNYIKSNRLHTYQ
jgi:hypothetical protein